MTKNLDLHHRVSQFLFLEARLLDEQRWEEWNALFAEDGEYWAPATANQPDPVNHVSLIHENDLLRKVRIARFKSPAAPSLHPFPRTAHLVTNVMIDKCEGEELTVNARFMMVEYRRDAQRVFAGAYTHDLVEDGETFLIRRKKADLVNCEGPLESSSVWF